MNPIIYRNEFGQIHRDYDLSAIEWGRGSKEWYVNGKRHRAGDLPAIYFINETTQWWKDGQLHREGGLPAVKYFCGENLRLEEWWINDRKLSDTQAIAYILFCQKMQEKKKLRAQKKIYYWWVQICYDMKRECGKRMAKKNVENYKKMMEL